MASPVIQLKKEIFDLIPLITSHQSFPDQFQYSLHFDDEALEFSADSISGVITLPVRRLEYLWTLCNTLHQTELQIRGISVPEQKVEYRHQLLEWGEARFQEGDDQLWPGELPAPKSEGYSNIDDIFLNAVAWSLHQVLYYITPGKPYEPQHEERDLVIMANEWLPEQEIGKKRIKGKIEAAIAACAALI